MYLVDTSIWLEGLLNQKRADEVQAFLSQTYSKEMFITDLSLHTITIVLLRFNRTKELNLFIDDLFENGKIEVLSLSPIELKNLPLTMDKHNLDYEDAYQYQCALKHDLILVTLTDKLKSVDRKILDPKEIIY